MRKIVPSLIFIFCLILSRSSFARFATLDEAPVKRSTWNEQVKINKDGTYERISEYDTVILTESGRKLGTQTVNFNPHSHKVEILEAKTIINGNEIMVPEKDIQLREINTSLEAFDNVKTYIISFPRVEVGARLYIKLKEECFKSFFENHYVGSLVIGNGERIDDFNIEIKSDLKLNIDVQDPDKSLDFSQQNIDSKDIIKIKLKKPIYKFLINEAHSVIDPEAITRINLSSFNNEKEIAELFMYNYEKVKNQKLPDRYLEIAKTAKEFKKDEDIFNHVTSRIASIIRYMGDWRTVDGAMRPRNLKEVVESGYGDCKDFSSATAAILSHLGYKTNVALVNRQIGYINPKKPINWMWSYNHAITYIEGKDGKALWVDPTNPISMYPYISEDISGRDSLILDPQNPRIEFIQDMTSFDNKLLRKEVIEILENQSLIEGTVSYKGDEALMYTQRTQETSIDEIKDIFVKYNVLGSNILNSDVQVEGIPSRVLKDVIFNYKINVEKLVSKSNLGDSLPVPGSSFLESFDIPRDNQGVVFISPRYYETELLLKNVEADDVEKLNFDIASKWARYKNNFTNTKDGVLMSIKLEIFPRYLKRLDYNSKDFHDFRGKVISNKNNIIVFRKKLQLK